MTGSARYPEIGPYAQGMLDVGDGQLIHWAVCGNPDGKPAVVVHGGPGSGCLSEQSQEPPAGSVVGSVPRIRRPTSETGAGTRRPAAAPQTLPSAAGMPVSGTGTR